MAKKRAAPKNPPPEPRPWTPMDEAFTQSILEAPEDDAPRLIYADWLEEQGEAARVELIRGQIRLARMPQDAPEFTALSSRMDELLRTHRAEWLRLMTRWADQAVTFTRGFPDSASTNFSDFVNWEESLWKVAPVATLQLFSTWQFDSNWGGTFDSEEEMRDSHHESFREVAASPNLAHIRSLTMYECLEDRDIEALAGSPNVGRLRTLAIGYNNIGDTGAIAIAESTRLVALRHLDLSSNSIGPRGALALAGSDRLEDLETLDLSHNNLDEAAREALRERFGERVKL